MVVIWCWYDLGGIQIQDQVGVSESLYYEWNGDYHYDDTAGLCKKEKTT